MDGCTFQLEQNVLSTFVPELRRTILAITEPGQLQSAVSICQPFLTVVAETISDSVFDKTYNTLCRQEDAFNLYTACARVGGEVSTAAVEKLIDFLQDKCRHNTVSAPRKDMCYAMMGRIKNVFVTAGRLAFWNLRLKEFRYALRHKAPLYRILANLL